MKRLIITLAVVTLAAVSYHASAATITNLDEFDNPLAFDGTFVGFTDQFVEAGVMCQGNPNNCGADELTNSNPTSETLWVNSVLADPVEWVVKTETVPLYETDETNVFAVELASDSPEYFLVKNSTHVALFRNDLLYNWGVFDITDIKDIDGNIINMNLGDITVSHVSEFIEDGSRTVVPIPPAVWLFGSGLLGLVGIARRKV